MKLILCGCSGRMGGAVTEYCKSKNIDIAAGVDVRPAENAAYPVYKDISEYRGEADAIIDFSSPQALDGVLSYAAERDIPAVLAVTGYTDGDIRRIGEFAKTHRVFRSPNMSIGVALLTSLVKKAAAVEGYDAEIVEKHHRNKLDAPSGTAIMLAEAIKKVRGGETVTDRASVCGKRVRGGNEIGIASVRGGSIVGEHEVIFAGDGETLTISHSAENRGIFASGAVAAARFIALQKPGRIYGMEDLIDG